MIAGTAWRQEKSCRFFLRLQGRVAAVAVVVGAVAKSSEKALVKRFCKKKLHRIFVRLEKMVSVFLSFPAILKHFLRLNT